MAIQFHPKVGQILLCDFSVGFKEPEMVKNKRPVLVVASDIAGRVGLVTVLALSTKVPDPIKPYHYKIPRSSMPQLGRFQENDTWLKGDMIYTVGFHRLDLIMLGKRDPTSGKRVYFQNKLGRDQMKEVYKCMLHGLNLGKLSAHL
ncbi:type II toxin-antitoxin system PemK/MazF family toxin [Marinomonas spartinae]|uniref:type II toxin-antitoxin system PemK/MazF family toxin n=1 Tax=Marinomonas spartinae TaxID=1792290 RepID=UPI0018F19C0E|nr:type II toxin-antitoxin system PemK/MazF family toxin [Marinomonas spartinae]MBJ7553138.1 type II toxin-antitoxin system PemK/MazF family toxin [Marinomonas spartinae]